MRRPATNLGVGILLAEHPDADAGSPPDGLVREAGDDDVYEYYPLGEYVVAPPGVCQGRPTFKHTRIDVAFILGRLENGETVEDLAAAYDGRLTREAIREAQRLSAVHPPQFFSRPYAPPGAKL